MRGGKVSSFIFSHAILSISIVISVSLLAQINDTHATSHMSSILNVSTEQTENCQIEIGCNESVVTHGSPTYMCSWRVNVSDGSSISLQFPESGDTKSYFLYTNLHDSDHCNTRYASIEVHSSPCEIGFKAQNLSVHLQGNLSISISATSSSFSSDCLETQTDRLTAEPNTSSQNCASLKRYDSAIKCAVWDELILTSKNNTSLFCDFHFLQYCNASLGYREVIFECPRDTSIDENASENLNSYTKITMLIYPTNAVSLNLAAKNITKIEVTAFHGLNTLTQLFLGSNYLDEITTHLFRDLQSLTVLDISGNYLKMLQNGSFDGLYNLRKLYLSNNQLSHLEVDVLQNLINLQTLDFYLNELTFLQPGIFKGLTRLEYLNMAENKLSSFQYGVFLDLYSLRQLWLGYNQFENLDNLSNGDLKQLRQLVLYHNQLITLTGSPFQDLSGLTTLQLRGNQMHTLGANVFHGLENLINLFLDLNELQELPSSLFRGLYNLQVLFLIENRLTTLDSNIFLGLNNLTILILGRNLLSQIGGDVFKDTSKLIFLDLGYNKLTELPNLGYLTQLTYLNLRSNSLTKLKDSFPSSIQNADILVTQPEICQCYMPPDAICTAFTPQSPFLTCDRLLSNKGLQIFMWIIGTSALCGNAFVLGWRKNHEKDNKVQSILLSNLAISDFLMGVYMIIIASADIHFGDYFPMNSEFWRTSITCKIAGALSILSSEASVFFVTFISIDRVIGVKYPYSANKLGVKSVALVVSILWLIALSIAIAPSLYMGKESDFYEISHVCIGLPLAQIQHYYLITDTQREMIGAFRYRKEVVISQGVEAISGAYFSTAVFLGLNCLCYLIILVCYIVIIKVIYKTAKDAGRQQVLKTQIRLNLKVAAIVGTDFLCWFPIIILGILVQTRVITLPASVVEWCVTFVLPINSAINPYLYTIGDVISRCRNDRQMTQSGSKNAGFQMKTITSNVAAD